MRKFMTTGRYPDPQGDAEILLTNTLAQVERYGIGATIAALSGKDERVRGHLGNCWALALGKPSGDPVQDRLNQIDRVANLLCEFDQFRGNTGRAAAFAPVAKKMKEDAAWDHVIAVSEMPRSPEVFG